MNVYSAHIFNLSGKTKKSIKNKNKHTPYASYYQVTQFLFQVQTSLLLESLKGTRKLQASELLHTHTHGHSYWRQAIVIKRWDRSNTTKAPDRHQPDLHQTRLHTGIFFQHILIYMSTFHLNSKLGDNKQSPWMQSTLKYGDCLEMEYSFVKNIYRVTSITVTFLM